MSKPGLDGATIGPVLKEKSSHVGWSMCIGAGVSVPAFPSWPELVENLVKKELGDARGKTVADALLKRFSPDALIQAAHDRSGKNDRRFAKELSSMLYRTLKSSLGRSGWAIAREALTAASPGDLQISDWTRFRDGVRQAFPGMASLGIAETIVDLHGEKFAPRSIISFNAESVLYALVHAEHTLRSYTITPSGDVAYPKRLLDRVTHSVSYRRPNRIPYVYCHGLLPLVGKAGKLKPQSVDKLVFSEAEYLGLANRNFSWHANVFAEAALFHSMVFVGVSLSDPNMRRWLSWIHENRKSELKTLQKYKGDSTVHFWVTLRAQDDETNSWIESSVSHLGVRLVWINAWAETSATLRRMLGL
ncbi:MAG: SIR2 family protein [Planctomycetes bacterium]|nr:SIR2 family protein [Planctomycetota bacterium]